MNTYALPEKKKISILGTAFYYTPLVMSLLFFVMLLSLGDIARASVIASLDMCVKILIPSLFPFMVMGEILFFLGAAELLGRILGKPFERCFGISGCGVGAFLLGAVCGLPLGGKYALTLYKNGIINKRDCEALMGISTNAGMGFAVMGIGVGIWGSYSFGWLIYLCQIFSSVLTGIIFRQEKKSPIIAPATVQITKKPFNEVFTEAISSSVVAMLKICGFTVFFGVLNSYISWVCIQIGLPSLFLATILSFTEISKACSSLHTFYCTGASAMLHSARVLTFFSVGFAGLSVHMQLSSFVGDLKISMKKYYLQKLLCGLICSATGAILLHFLSF